MATGNQPTLLTWQGDRASARDGAMVDGADWIWSLAGAFRLKSSPTLCPVCGVVLIGPTKSGGGGYSEQQHRHRVERRNLQCELCGWNFESEDVFDSIGYDHFNVVYLARFHTAAAQPALDALAATGNADELHALGAMRLQERICNVFKDHGFNTLLSAPTRARDGRAILLEHGRTHSRHFVTCAVDQRARSAYVAPVATLVGIGIDWSARKGTLVTEQHFRSAPEPLRFTGMGIALDLSLVSEFLQLLHVYNPKLPALHALTEQQRSEVAARYSATS